MAEIQVKTNALPVRPPIVVILGHVDHGKTKILDYIRQTKVAEGEAGGITQHIGAYQVEVPEEPKSALGGQVTNRTITFLDTPGHEAFSAIRSRGAQVADIAILVIAADEGVKPQTKEAIKIIKESNTPFIVALNKIDKPEANAQRIKQELAENEVFVEGYGGDISCVEISAKTGDGIDGLLELILLTADVAELGSDDAQTEAVVIESHLDNRRGLVATLLVRSGYLRVGQWLATGTEPIKVKMLEDFRGKGISEAGPSQPAVVLGWTSAPALGERVLSFTDKAKAQQAVISHPAAVKERLFAPRLKAKNLNLIIKADVASSLEAIDQVLQTIQSDEVGYQVIDCGVGLLSDGDIKKATSTQAIVIGFHLSPNSALKQMAEREQVKLFTFDIIYELVEEVKKQMSLLLTPEVTRTPLGRLKIIAIFKREGRGQIVGGKVISGKLKRGALVDVTRNGQLVVTGRLAQLQQAKADVEEVTEGLEAGLRCDFVGNITPNLFIREGDLLEVYSEEHTARSL